jgi:endogenous inhibitor of DNA gyrase (YacG/DUF329 family)
VKKFKRNFKALEANVIPMTLETEKLKVRCPNCKEWTRWKDNPFRPFCSETCRSNDLGNWATERYRITPGEGDESTEIKPEKEEE